MSLFKKKSLDLMLSQSNESGGLKRTLGPINLILLGIGAIIGAGLFVRTAAAAGQAAGNAVTISFIIAAIGCAFAGLCYAEFSTMIPISGSAYAYSYVTMGEIVAWIIGWALILEYALGAATVSIAWSEYLNKFLIQFFDTAIPYEWCHSPFESYKDINGVLHTGSFNIIAVFILFLITLVLIKGVQESAFVNGIIVVIKVAIVVVFIIVGWQFIKPENYVPYLIPENAPPIKDIAGNVIVGFENWNRHGIGGVLGGAGIVFFAFIGFDAVSTAAQEAKNPKKDMPIGILGSLVICTILYILFAHVLTGVTNWRSFMDPLKGKEASVVYAIQYGMPGYGWLEKAVTIAILGGFSSVILVMLMGQSRVFYSMSKDGLIPNIFSELHPIFKTPYKSNLILFVFVGLIAGIIPGSKTGDLTSFGTLFAFVIVCLGIWILRIKKPDQPRPFKTPLVPLVPILGVIVCVSMIASLDTNTLIMSLIWMLTGLIIYFVYSKKRSKLN